MLKLDVSNEHLNRNILIHKNVWKRSVGNEKDKLSIEWESFEIHFFYLNNPNIEFWILRTNFKVMHSYCIFYMKSLITIIFSDDCSVNVLFYVNQVIYSSHWYIAIDSYQTLQHYSTRTKYFKRIFIFGRSIACRKIFDKTFFLFSKKVNTQGLYQWITH